MEINSILEKRVLIAQIDSVSSQIAYFASGICDDNGFTGVVYGYEGAGEYSVNFALKNKYMPCVHKDGEAISDDYKIKLLEHAIKDEGFIARAQEKIDAICDFNDDQCVYMAKDVSIYTNDLYREGKWFVPLVYSMCASSNQYSMKEFIKQNYTQERLGDVIKETFEQVVVAGKKSNIENTDMLKTKTISKLREDDIYLEIISIGYIEVYLTAIIAAAKASSQDGICLSKINICDCEVCDECGKGLLPNDECYTEHLTDKPLCDSCSYYDIEYSDGVYIRSSQKQEYLKIKTNQNNVNRTRSYGLRVGDTVVEKAFGMESSGVVVRRSHDNNKVFIEEDNGNITGVVAEYCTIVKKVDEQ